MRHKILVWTHSEEQIFFQDSLAHFLELGGELFMALSFEDAHTILRREKPQLIFIDHRFLDQVSVLIPKQSVCYLIGEKDYKVSGYSTLERPLSAKRIADCSKAVFSDEFFIQIPPM